MITNSDPWETVVSADPEALGFSDPNAVKYHVQGIPFLVLVGRDGNVYVAQVAMGANMTQVVKAFTEAEAYPGVSLIIAFSPCIAHGLDMSTQMQHQKAAADSGYWPLYRFDPGHTATDHLPFQLDSKKPKIAYTEFANKEARFAMLARSKPEEAKRLFALAQQEIDERYKYYSQLSGVERVLPDDEPQSEAKPEESK